LSAAFNGVIKRVPPRNDSQSPMEETVTSRWLPWWAKGGRSAVTITAAMFSTFRDAASTFTPRRSSMAVSDWRGEVDFTPSPVPSSPTTRP